MIRTILIAGALLCASNPAAAQMMQEPSPYAVVGAVPTCTGEELRTLTAAYVEAQRSGDISALPFHADAQYLENMANVEQGEGLWNTALPIADDVSFHDNRRCKTLTQIIVTEGGHPYVTATRLWVDGGVIIRLESVVSDEGDWLFNANSYLTYTRKDGWADDIGVYQRTSEQDLIDGANAYMDAFSDRFVEIPWGTPCGRIEGGAYTNVADAQDASCELGIPDTGTLYVVERDFMVDEEKGVINIFCFFGGSNGNPDSHTFRFIDGKMRAVNALTILFDGEVSPEVNDDGSISGFDPNAG